MVIEALSIQELVSAMASGKLTCKEVVTHYLANIEKQKNLNAILEVFEDALSQAADMDDKIAQGYRGKLAGVPVIIKDNILYQGKKCSCASLFLKNYVAQYNATVVEKLLQEGAIIIARANMDEFAMGGSTENSAYGVCHNAHDFDRVAGGSSGGSAVAVAAKMAPIALGTDTGGSVRQPSSFNGVVGVKPTYGRISRYGVVAFASSLEQVGPITNSVEDNAYVLEILSGRSEHDETSVDMPVESYASNLQKNDLQGTRIGIIRQMKESLKGMPNEAMFDKALSFVKDKGAEIIDIDLPEFNLTVPCYYIIAPAEATSNLGRFDGVKYTERAQDAKDVDEIYIKSRTNGFGHEVKRRIMLGNFVLSSGYFDAYYNKAKQLQQKIKNETQLAMQQCDVLLLPTTVGEAFKIGEKSNDPISMYQEDRFTVLANISGMPAISIPVGKGENGLPVGLQILAKPFAETEMYQVANFIYKSYQGA